MLSERRRKNEKENERNRLHRLTDLQLDFNWVVKSNQVLFQECQDVIPALFTGGARRPRTQERTRRKKTGEKKRIEEKERRRKDGTEQNRREKKERNKVRIQLKSTKHHHLNHKVFFLKIFYLLTQDLIISQTGQITLLTTVVIKIQSNRTMSTIKTIFINQIDLSHYHASINQF